MRFVLILLLFSCVMCHANCRPNKYEDQAELNQAEESGDYREGQEDEAAANDDSAQQDNDEPPNEKDQNYSENEVQPEFKLDKAKYHENHDLSDQKNAQYAYNRAIDEFKQSLQQKNAVNDRVVKKRSKENAVDSKSDGGDLLFENYLRNQQKSNSKIAFNNQGDNRVLSEQPRYFRRYYNTGNRKQQSRSCKSDLNRREAQDAAPSESNLKNKLETDEISSEEEATAIKRHVKKLTSGELEQLLSSLSDDKRGLLKKIIDNSENTNLIKREITKKAGAIEQNNLVESCQSQSVSPSVVDSDAAVSLNTDTEKSSENVSGNDLLLGRSVHITPGNKANTARPSDDEVQSIITGNDDQAQSLSTGSCSTVQDADLAAVTKSANKREAHNDDYNANPDETADKTYYNERDGDEGYLTAQEEDESSEVENDEAAEETAIPRKREASCHKYSELSDSERSLEESFPNSKANEYSDPYAASDMLPLVRVKRKNTESVPAVVKKRAAAVMPDAKVAFVPYKAENDDEDNDEANEFDDNGFYDRTSNLKVDDKCSNVDSESSGQEVQSSNDNAEGRDSSNLNENLRYDKANIGSDTDGVLSGVEGVDENLMFSKQNAEVVDQNCEAVELRDDREGKQIRKKRSLPEEELHPKNIGKPTNAPIYHEIDAFGPLPQDRDTGTSRFKRIRRVKQLPEVGETRHEQKPSKNV